MFRTEMIAVVCFFIFVGFSPADSPKPEPKKGVLPAADFKLACADLEKECQKDPKAAELKFKGKVIELSGTIQNVLVVTGGKTIGIFLKSADPNTLRHGALCLADDPKLLGTIGRGQSIRLKGVFDGAAGVPRLSRCEIQEKGPETIIKVSSEEIAKEHTVDGDKAKKKYEEKTLVVTGQVVAVKPYPTNDKLKYLELKGDGKTVVECRFSELDQGSKYKVGDTVTVVGEIVVPQKDVVNLTMCFPMPK